MNYEEKYKNALERAKELCDVADSFTITIHDICTIFPELQEQESEDERIREALIKILNKIVINTNYKELGIDYNIRDMIAWLEKQCEKTHAELSQQKVTKTSDQELSDKMEPKTLDADKLYDEVTKRHWTSVEDELPPRGRTDPYVSVPVITCEIVNRGLHEIGFQRYIFGKGKWEYCDATHWMPMPEAPTIAENATVKKGGEE